MRCALSRFHGLLCSVPAAAAIYLGRSLCPGSTVGVRVGVCASNARMLGAKEGACLTVASVLQPGRGGLSVGGMWSGMVPGKVLNL